MALPNFGSLSLNTVQTNDPMKYGLGPVRDGSYTKGNTTYNVNTSQQNTGNKNSGKIGSGTTSNASGGMDYASMISALYEKQLAAQRAARQAAYDSTVQTQTNNYNSAMGKVNNAANKALQEAYINRMLSEKNINQQLSAQGLNGGATESTLAGVQNNYGNSRNNIETNRQDNVSDLSNTYQNNLAQAKAALESGFAGDYSNYATNLASLVASNPTQFVNTTQDASGGGTSLAALQKLLQSGYGTSTQQDVSSGTDNSSMLSAYLKALSGY